MKFEKPLQSYLEQHPEAPGDIILASRMIVRTAHIITSTLNSILEPFDLTIQEYLAVVLINNTTGPVRPTEISETLGISRPQVTRLLDTLEKRGHITRQKSPKDRRALFLKLTQKGKELFENSITTVHDAYRRCWDENNALAHESLPILRDIYYLLLQQDALAPQHRKKYNVHSY